MMSLGIWRTLTIILLLLYFLFPDLPHLFCIVLSGTFHESFMVFFLIPVIFLLIICLFVAADSPSSSDDTSLPPLVDLSPLVALCIKNASWIMDRSKL